MKRILIVDDSPVARRYHGSILKRAGYRIDEAADGTEALEKALRDPADLILCDINMAGMDGLTFIRKFRENDYGTPIIIISTQAGETDREIGLSSGADVYVVKPVDPEKLVIHVNLILGSPEDEP